MMRQAMIVLKSCQILGCSCSYSTNSSPSITSFPRMSAHMLDIWLLYSSSTTSELNQSKPSIYKKERRIQAVPFCTYNVCICMTMRPCTLTCIVRMYMCPSIQCSLLHCTRTVCPLIFACSLQSRLLKRYLIFGLWSSGRQVRKEKRTRFKSSETRTKQRQC